MNTLPTLLRIDASVRASGSRSRELADYFEQQWLRCHPDGRVVRRDLASSPVPHLDGATVVAFFQGGGGAGTAWSDEVVHELQEADEIVISSPLYNLSLPSTLKAWIDHVVRLDRTFERTGDGYRGLLRGRNAYLLTATGGTEENDPMGDFHTPYLRTVLGFMGIHDVDSVAVVGGEVDEEEWRRRLGEAHARIDAWLTPVPEPTWIGEYSVEDKRELIAARRGQADAITRGDAEAYGRLCADDVRLMVPGHDPVVGRASFLVAERALFAKTSFLRFRKFPERIERSGNLAVETGTQVVSTDGRSGGAGVFAARQKYTHVFRCTPEGWRFAVLMSNSSL